jgi:hypothetical protein
MCQIAMMRECWTATRARIGPRRAAAPVSTVRRSLRRVQGEHTEWLREQGVQHAYRADPDILNSRLVWPTPLGDALNLLAAAALAYQRRWDWQLPVWTLIGMITRGRLLPPPRPPRHTRKREPGCCGVPGNHRHHAGHPKTAVLLVE